MQTLQLGWQPAAVGAAGLLGAAALLARSPARTAQRVMPYLRETGLVAALYALWQVAGTVSVLGTGGALERGRRIVAWQRDWHLPSEQSVQHLVIGHPLLVQACNLFYAGVHFTALGVLLVWLFVRHRDRYPRVRTVLVLLTASSLLIQLIPVAPPRLLAGYGFVDTAARYGQSVYTVSGLTVDELAAMPSVHVGWAFLVAWAAVTAGRGRWRWLVVAHPVLTVFVVVATANHYWLDGIVAVLLLVSAIGVYQLAARLVTVAGRPRVRADAAPREPVVAG